MSLLLARPPPSDDCVKQTEAEGYDTRYCFFCSFGDDWCGIMPKFVNLTREHIVVESRGLQVVVSTNQVRSIASHAYTHVEGEVITTRMIANIT
jgi:hypothetical protein